MILLLKTADFSAHMWLYASPESTGPIVAREWESGRELSDQLLSEITGMLTGQNAKLTDLTGIVVFSGPGSFTSLRIGHTIANALADGLKIPVLGIQGDDWAAAGLAAIAGAPVGRPALPHYGSEANITKPKS